ncbi:ABC transporter substrate-binding protein [Pseudonocardia nematodicida]|uniref:ABC transporter substrate-binding protein n=1 Tax=Pseudonocardia nematodicida TaxID=1206997 RepID=A0ABV1K730_9PSEU
MPFLIEPEAAAGPLDRRTLLGLTAGAAATLVLGGCGTTGGTAPEQETRTEEGAFGPVEVPVSPERIVATDFYTTYALLDVGVTVVATVEAATGGVLPSLQAAYDAIPKVGRAQEPSLEAIAAQEPDLILGTLTPALPEDLPERLSGVAPTLMLPADGAPGTWQQRAVRAAEVVGRGPEAEALRDRYEQRAREIGERHRDLLGRIRIGLVRGGAPGIAQVDLPDSWGGVVLGAIGARMPAIAEGKPGASEEVSYEDLGVLDDCDILLHHADTDGGIQGNTRRMLDAPTFQALPAVTAGRLYPLPNYYVAHYGQGEAVLTELDRILGEQG